MSNRKKKTGAGSARGEHTRPQPADQSARDAIHEDLDTTILVEAAAGTGKTTGMVGRMIALLAAGKCAIHNLAAVTFTRKAAAELRDRFQTGLERAAADTQRSAEERRRLAAALDRVESCFTGTIHAFCARLLRERPVEARVSVDFAEIEEEEDGRYREAAWDLAAAALIAENDPLAGEMRELGLELKDLKAAFAIFAQYPDVDEWPAPDAALPDPRPAAEALAAYVRRMQTLIPGFPEDTGNDELMDCYWLIVRLFGQCNPSDPLELKDVLGVFDGTVKLVQKCWPGGQKGGLGKEEAARWEAFRVEVALPYLRRFEAVRYNAIMRLFAKAREKYDALRRRAGVLNFQDLLMAAARLLRSSPHVRRYFSGRITHLLVDEFQDTDPVQAEIMLLLTAGDQDEANWRRCRPVPGSLFVVGDPKQSIYRFRRADIVTYNAVRDIITAAGGRVVHLSTSFRTTGSIVRWVNEAFAARFSPAANDHSPAYVPLYPWRGECAPGPLGGVRVIEIPDEHANGDAAVEFEAAFVARTIKALLDGGAALPGEGEKERPVHPGDFLIVTRTTKHLAAYARALQELDVPHQVTGGAALNELAELRLLHLVLAALVRPDDPVALVAVLRSELFGVSDRALFRFHEAGGEFDFEASMPKGLAREDGGLFEEAFDILRKARGWLFRLPPAAAAQRIAQETGLLARAAGAPGGDVQAGSLAKAFEILRRAQADGWSVEGAVEILGEMVAGPPGHDGVSALCDSAQAVRVMNLHKAKGLEAPVVFLADPTGGNHAHRIFCHVDRSGPRVRGYIAVYGPARGQHGDGPLLARPDKWDEHEAREREFLDAEQVRLEYVAATRAGAQLGVVHKLARNDRNPWKCFEEHLRDCPVIADPGRQKRTRPRLAVVSAADAAAAAGDIAERWKTIRTESYSVRLASQAAGAERAAGGKERKTGAAAAAADDQGRPVQADASAAQGDEFGAAWGRVIHQLLEAAAVSTAAFASTAAGTAASEAPGALELLAASLLRAEDLDPALAAEAAQVVERVRAAPFWKRALAGSPCLVEVPLMVRMNAAGEQTAIANGRIDLAFRENGGWVLVDYKTDDRRKQDPGALIEKYRPQLELYARAWTAAVGEPVAEKGIFFVHTRRYQQV